jgi:immunity protein, SdpI family
MTGTRRARAREIAVLATGYLAGLLAYPLLPGAFLAERPSMRIMVAFTLPTTALVIYGLFRSLWTHDRVRTGNGAFRATYESIVFRALLFVVALHVIVMIELTDVMDAAGIRTVAGRMVIVLLGLTFMAIGNLLPRTRPNVGVGVRTKRTLANAQLWQQVHRVSGYATVGLGVVIFIIGFVMTKKSAGALVLGASGVAAMIVYASYRRHARA